MEKNNTLLEKFTILKSSDRLHQIDRPIIALTGGIATGKSTVVAYLKNLNYQVLSADQLIKDIYAIQETQDWLITKRPLVFENKKINFVKLRTETFTDNKFKLELETYLYSKLPNAFRAAYAKLPKHHFFFYEVPLLIEKKLYPLVDIVVLIHSNLTLQKERLAIRDNESKQVHENILKSQLSMADKKVFSHFIISNDGTTESLQNEVDNLLVEVNRLILI